MEVKISGAEFRVSSLVDKGYTNKEIAEELCISCRTVETHLSNLYLSANVNSRVQLIVWLKSNSFKAIDRNLQGKIDLAHKLKAEGKSIAQISKIMQVHYSTAHLYLKKSSFVDQSSITYTEFRIIVCPPKTLCYFWGA
jgi:DNA-binding CsgD family transcriptional regulator